MLPRRLIKLVRIQNPVEFFARYAPTPKHLLHIGAHLLEESQIYDRLAIPNVSWVEGNPRLEEANIRRFPDSRVLYKAVTNEDDSSVILNLTANSVSSSIYHIDPHSTFNNVVESESIEVLTKTLDSVYVWANECINQKVDSIVIDVQGAEGVILKGPCNSLRNINVLAIEVSHRKFYVDAEDYLDINYKLKMMGLRKVTSFINPLTGHGDELWISKNMNRALYNKLRFVGALRDSILILLRFYENLFLTKKDK